MIRSIGLFFATVAVGLSGCMSPGLKYIKDPKAALEVDKSGPTVDTIEDHIQCEMARAVQSVANSPTRLDKDPNPLDPAHPATTLGEYFQTHKYVAQVSLTADVTDTQSANAALNFIHLYTTSTNFTMGFAGQYNQTRHRSFNYYFPAVMKAVYRPPQKGETPFSKEGMPVAPGVAGCPNEKTPNTANEIDGKLGIDTALYSGVIANLHTRTTANAESEPSLLKQNNLSFTTQIDFQVLWSAGLGPNWTLTTFKGPTGGGGGSSGGGGGSSGGGGNSQLLNTSNTNKNTVIIAFAPVGDKNKRLALATADAKIKDLQDASDSAAANLAITTKRIARELPGLEAPLNLDKTRPAPAPSLAPEALTPQLNDELDRAEGAISQSPKDNRVQTQGLISAYRNEIRDAQDAVATARRRVESAQADRARQAATESEDDESDAQDAAGNALSRYLLQGLQQRLR